jgi:hypothetical protein
LFFSMTYDTAFSRNSRETARLSRAIETTPPPESYTLPRLRSDNQTGGGPDPIHSFKSLLADLATIAANRIKPNDTDLPTFTVITTPTPIQRRVFQLLGLSYRLGYA